MIDQGRLMWKKGLVLALFSLAIVQRVNADPVKLGLRLNERYSDNVDRRSSNPKSDLEHRATLSIRQKTSPGPCGSDLNADIGYVHYQKHTYADQADTNGNWDGFCHFTQNLQWRASDNISQQTLNTAQPSTPNNQTRRNFFETGPQYLWPITHRDQLLTSAQYQQTNYTGEAQSNAKHYMGSTNYSHQVSPTLSMGLGGTYDRGRLDTGETITRRSGNFNTSKTFAETKFSGSLGYSELEDNYNGISSKNSGVIWNLRLDRQMTEARSWYAQFGREYTDTSSAYAIQVAGLLFNNQQTSAVKVTHWRSGINQNFIGGASLGFSVGQQYSDYLRYGYTQKDSSANLTLSQRLTPTLSGRVNVGAGHVMDGLKQISYNDYNGSLGLSYHRTKQLSLNMEVGRNQRTGSQNTTTYKEDWVMVGVNYAFR